VNTIGGPFESQKRRNNLSVSMHVPFFAFVPFPCRKPYGNLSSDRFRYSPRLEMTRETPSMSSSSVIRPLERCAEDPTTADLDDITGS